MRVVTIHLFANPRSPRGSAVATVSVSWLEGDDGQELPCPFGDEREFKDAAEAIEALTPYFGRSFVFEVGAAHGS
jgi:hypothetical protein